MNEKNYNVMIFMPFSPKSNWRGEGIAQTIESIIRYSADKITYTLVVGSHVEKEVTEELSKEITSNRLKLIPIGFNKKKIDREKDSFVAYRISCLLFYLSLGFFIIKQAFFSFLRISKYHFTFVPSPLLSIVASIFSKKMAISFWDPFVLEYPHAFSESFRLLIVKLLKYGVHSADVVITQSNTNKNYLIRFFGLDSKKIKVIENGHPDYRCYLYDQAITTENIMMAWDNKKEFVSDSRMKLYYHYLIKKKTHRSLKDNLKKNVLHRLITKDSPKESKIIVISTQYRPYKGFESLFLVCDSLIKKYYSQYKFKFLFTGSVPLVFYQKYAWANALVFEMQRLESRQHAYIYSIADLVIHPSFVEGGMGTYPMFEAASLNVPSLSNMGRHMLELQKKYEEDIDVLCIDLIDIEAASEKIFMLLTNTELRKHNVSLTNSVRTFWEDSGKKYQDLFEELAL